jgi:hypothetical protein
VKIGLLRRVMAVVALAGALDAPLWAYVDPGFAAALYQALYALIFGGIAAVLLTPWRAVTAFLRRRFGRNRGSEPDSLG